MKVSVITPTADRQHLLRGTYLLLQQQTHANWEWLIYDTSLKKIEIPDARIKYIHDEAIVSIGEKRNRLIQKATGDVIVHMDDDDYYASDYLENSIKRLKQWPFFTFHSWFSYDTKSRQFFYWDTQHTGKMHYCVDALTGSRVREIEFGTPLQQMSEKLNHKGKTGYGFSFAYTRDVARLCSFPDLDYAEDRAFYEEVEKQQLICGSSSDERGEVVHVIHDENTSSEFPQYRVPPFLVRPLFPSFFEYLKQNYEN